MKAIRIAFILALVAVPVAAQDKVKFEPKFTKDVPFFQQVTTKVEQTITVQGGSELKLAHSQVFQFKWTPTKQEGDKWTVDLVIEGMKLNIDIATNQVKYDSAAPTDGGNNPVLAEFFKKLKDTRFTVTLGKGGIVEKVDGRDDFLKNLGGTNPQMETILKKILADESLKEMADPMAGLTAAAEMAPNQDWTKVSKLPLGPIGGYERSVKFVYKQKEAVTPGNENVHRVEAYVDMKYLPPAAGEAADGLLFRIKGGELKPTADQKPGYYRFNAAKGYIADAELTLKMKGKLTVTLGASTETEVELFQTQSTKLETRDTTYNVQAGPVPGPGVPPKQ